MNLETAMERVDAGSARAFVRAARHVIDALMIEARSVRQTQTPGAVDYVRAELPREAPPGGWISHDEIDRMHQQMVEAITRQKWIEGAVFAIRLMRLFGG